MAQAADGVRGMAERAGVVARRASATGSVRGDADRLVQVLTNLLSNAIKFSPAGGTVWLEAEQSAGEVMFRVRDEGRGIPADKLETVFDRFGQVDPAMRAKKAERVSGWRSAAASSSSTAARSGPKAPWARARRCASRYPRTTSSWRMASLMHRVSV